MWLSVPCDKKNYMLTEAAVLKHLRETQATGDVVVDVAKIVPVIENSMDGTVRTNPFTSSPMT